MQCILVYLWPECSPPGSHRGGVQLMLEFAHRFRGADVTTPRLDLSQSGVPKWRTDRRRSKEWDWKPKYVYIYICILICHTQVFARHSGHPRGIPGMPQALNSTPGHIFAWEIRRRHSRGLKLAEKVRFINNVAKNLVFCWLSKWGEAWGISFSRVRGGQMYSGQVNY